MLLFRHIARSLGRPNGTLVGSFVQTVAQNVGYDSKNPTTHVGGTISATSLGFSLGRYSHFPSLPSSLCAGRCVELRQGQRNVPTPVAFVTNGKGGATRKFGPYANHKQYCERLRLIMLQHIGQVADEYREFFVANVDHQDAA